MPAPTVLPFYPHRIAQAHQFVSPDGRYWKASEYLSDEALAELGHGRSYTIPELKNLGLSPAGLALGKGDRPPVSVVYLRNKLIAGQE